MRPPKHILLVSENDSAVAPLRFSLRNCTNRPAGHSVGRAPCYRVTAALFSSVASNMLNTGRYDIVIVQLPMDGVKEIQTTANARFVPCLILTETPAPKGERFPPHVLFRPKMDELLDRIKVMTARKRGPKLGSHHGKKAA